MGDLSDNTVGKRQRSGNVGGGECISKTEVQVPRRRSVGPCLCLHLKTVSVKTNIQVSTMPYPASYIWQVTRPTRGCHHCRELKLNDKLDFVAKLHPSEFGWRDKRETSLNIVRPIVPWTFRPTKRWQSSYFPAWNNSSVEDILATSRVKSLLVNLENVSMKPGAAKTASGGKLIRLCTIFCIQIRSPWIFLQAKKKRCSKWKAHSQGTWHSSLTNFTTRVWTFSNAWESRKWKTEDVCIAYSKCGRINALFEEGKPLGVRAAGNRLRNRMNSTLNSPRLSRPFGAVGLPSLHDEYNRICGV